MKEFSIKINEIINNITEQEQCNITECAKILFNAMSNDLVVHVFATGHSHMFAEELFYRAGGLVQVNPILEPFLMQHEGSIRSTKFERLPGIAKIIYESLNLKEKEPFIIVSNSKEDKNLLIRRLARYYDKCEILYPKSYREEMLSYLESIERVYQNVF